MIVGRIAQVCQYRYNDGDRQQNHQQLAFYLHVSLVVCSESVVTTAAASESDVVAIETLQLIQDEHADVIGDAVCL